MECINLSFLVKILLEVMNVRKKNIPDFLKAKGFYISLLTGICALCVICIVYVNMLTSKDKDDKINLNESNNQMQELADNLDKNNLADSNVTDDKGIAGLEADVPTDLTGDAEVITAEEAKQTTSNSVVQEDKPEIINETKPVAPSTKKSNLTFNEEDGLLWPVEGNVIMNYSMSSVIYFQTLDQYKCNPAIIIQAEVGDDVLNAADGIVKDVSYNEETGNTVTVSVGNGYEIVYGQLDNVKAKKGQSVSEGSILGNVADPTKYYIKEGSNLFFEVLRNEETVNPMLLLR